MNHMQQKTSPKHHSDQKMGAVLESASWALKFSGGERAKM
jgi:hypothetical protein